ncbi:AraC family transcriptional regulator [Chryseobacterium sp. G0201]|uniref:AraC family transcriptional regulator n=1 Tax=Chryseobacterium sp. G0201 TaxID=2487065 RepID=UPI000F4E7D66|nr:AraC family transcriptional regulator [Chryseobacterium sp. G0201]AZA53937.1 helix-turn-helix domain-containing protein [Chryseobacterium sp. G0201]
MKKNSLILFCFLFSFAQPRSLNELQIDHEIKKKQNISPNNFDKIITLSTDIYWIAKTRNYKKGILDINSLLINNYFKIRNVTKVLQLSKEIEKLATESKNDTILANIYRSKAAAHIELGYYNQGLKELNKAINIVDKIEYINDRNYLKALTYREFAAYYIHINASVDSVLYYQNKCLQSALSIQSDKAFVRKKSFILVKSYMNIGMMNVALGRMDDAVIHLSKALVICQNDKKGYIHGDLEVSILNELAWIYYEQKKFNIAAHYAGKAEKKELQASLPYVRRDIYEISFKVYSALKINASSKKYTNLYIKLNDSLTNVDKNNVNIITEKNTTHKEQINTGSRVKNLLLILSIILVISVFYIVVKVLYPGHKISAKNLHAADLNELIRNESSIKNQSSSEIPIEKNVNIPEHTLKLIVLKLNKFEKSQKFIKKDISLTSLAIELNTNTRYLSEVIKQNKKKSYSNYINGLRIEYIKNKLIENPVYREYKISYLAEECGFSSREVFAVTFKKENAVTPSYFINSLNNFPEDDPSID